MPLPLVGVLAKAAGMAGRSGMMRQGAMMSARNAMSDYKDDKDSDNLSKLRKNSDKTSGRGWVKKAAGWMGVAAIARQSSIASANTQSVAKVLGGYADLLMLPFQPLVNKGLEFLIKPMGWMTKASLGLHSVIDNIVNPPEKEALANAVTGTKLGDVQKITYDKTADDFDMTGKTAQELLEMREEERKKVGGYIDTRVEILDSILDEAENDIADQIQSGTKLGGRGSHGTSTHYKVQKMLEKTADTRNAIVDQILLDAQAEASAVSRQDISDLNRRATTSSTGSAKPVGTAATFSPPAMTMDAILAQQQAAQAKAAKLEEINKEDAIEATQLFNNPSWIFFE